VREAGEILCFASACRGPGRPVARESEVDRGDRAAHLAPARVSQGAHLIPGQCLFGGLARNEAQPRWGVLLEDGHLEGLEAHGVACLPQPLPDVVGRGVIARRAGRPMAAVPRRNLAERAHVPECIRLLSSLDSLLGGANLGRPHG
jgi:hypothetical protein